jgi:cell division protein FtsW (lipid II flippase)
LRGQKRARRTGRAQSRKEESIYVLAILTTAGLATGLSCATRAELLVIFHVLLFLATTVVLSLLAATIATSLLATVLTTLLTALARASWRLLSAKILAFITTSTTHVLLEIVVLHSIVCHVRLSSHVFDG